jgi:hypothetical protein
MWNIVPQRKPEPPNAMMVTSESSNPKPESIAAACEGAPRGVDVVPGRPAVSDAVAVAPADVLASLPVPVLVVGGGEPVWLAPGGVPVSADVAAAALEELSVAAAVLLLLPSPLEVGPDDAAELCFLPEVAPTAPPTTAPMITRRMARMVMRPAGRAQNDLLRCPWATAFSE